MTGPMACADSETHKEGRMNSDELKRKFVEAVKRAAERSRELGEQLGKSN